MKTKQKLTVLVLVSVALVVPVFSVPGKTETYIAKKELSHAQKTWISALEWCESSASEDAINPKDRDGTPSYGAYQFKPSTLDYYAEMYHIATSSVMDYQTQRKVVEAMVMDADHINWSQQFPDCVNRKVGRPPRR